MCMYVCVHTWGGGDKIKFPSPLKKIAMKIIKIKGHFHNKV